MKKWKTGSLYSKFYFSDIFNFVAPTFFTHLAFSKKKKKKKKRKECILLNFKEAPAAVTGYRYIGKGYSKSDALLSTTLYYVPLKFKSMTISFIQTKNSKLNC